MTVGEPTTGIYKLAPGILTVAAMVAVEEFKDRDPVYPPDHNANQESATATWSSPRRAGTFYHAYEERRQNLAGGLQTFGNGAAVWVFGYMSNVMLRKMEDDFYDGVELATVTLQMPATDDGLTRLVTVNGFIQKPSLGETLSHQEGATNGYTEVTFRFTALQAATA